MSVVAVPTYRAAQSGNYVALRCPRGDCGCTFFLKRESLLYRQYVTVPCPGCFRIAIPPRGVGGTGSPGKPKGKGR